MNCNQAKENIFLYDQLPNDDKVSVDQHLAECDQCALLLEQFQQQQELITEASSWREEPLDQAALTERIMSVVGQSSQASIPWINAVSNQFNLAPVRYALASLSIVLIAFFVLEYNQTPLSAKVNQNNVVLVGSNPVLNSSKVRIALRRHKNKSAVLSLYDCLKQCNYKDDHEPCEGCKDRLNVLTKNYEDS